MLGQVCWDSHLASEILLRETNSAKSSPHTVRTGRREYFTRIASEQPVIVHPGRLALHGLQHGSMRGMVAVRGSSRFGHCG